MEDAILLGWMHGFALEGVHQDASRAASLSPKSVTHEYLSNCYGPEVLSGPHEVSIQLTASDPKISRIGIQIKVRTQLLVPRNHARPRILALVNMIVCTVSVALLYALC